MGFAIDMEEISPTLARMSKAEQLAWLKEWRKSVIRFLEQAKVERPLSDAIRKAYEKRGISTAWNLADNDDAVVFCLTAKDVELTPEETDAINLLRDCMRADRDGVLPASWPSSDDQTAIRHLTDEVKAAPAKARKESSNKALDAKNKDGRDRARQIMEIWASGKYANRNLCADEEWEAVGFGNRKTGGSGYKTAREALMNTPDPSPWPGKKKKQEK